MQFANARKPPIGIVYDSDLGSSIDSVLALALLHGFEGKNEARIAALSISNPNLKAAQLADIIQSFYASATTGLAAAFSQSLPVGLTITGKVSGDTAIASGLLAKTDTTGKAIYSPRVHRLTDTAIPEILIRNALSAQYDQNAAIVLAGPATNLVKLLDLPGGRELVVSKVKTLVVAGGTFAPGAVTESPFVADIPAAKRLFAEWPTPIVAGGQEIGAVILFPAASIEKDFAYSPSHPVAEAYKAYRPMPYDSPTSSMAAVLYAVRSKQEYFRLSDPGEIRIGTDGRTSFQRSESGTHRYLVIEPGQKDQILKVYTEFASAKPVPRTFRRPQVVDNKVDEGDGKADIKKDPAVAKPPQ